jgi:putative oxidoreductase
MRKWLFLNGAQSFGDFALLILRLVVGLFLIWGVWDNITSSAEMAKFAGFLEHHKFPNPAILAPLSVYTQFLAGLGIVLGLFTRWAGILVVVNFVIAIVMVDRFAGVRGTFPAAALVAIGLYLATHGAGRLSLDTILKANETPRAKNSGVRLKK